LDVRRFVYYAIAASVTAFISIGVLYLALSAARERLTPLLVDQLLINMSEEEKQRLYGEIAANVGSLWDAVPDPSVARLGKRNFQAVQDQAEVKLNNAGLRSSRPFTRKGAGVFRIVCLGDSMVFGHGGLEADRFCDQLEEFYRDAGVTVDGRTIELYAVGIDSWTATQEAAYLSSRISAYDPDVIIVLTTGNDITDSAGVTGGGTSTYDFSPEDRASGSGVFANIAGNRFGAMGPSVVYSDLVPEARKRWSKATAALKRLTELQHRREKHILHSVLVIVDDYFTEMYKHFFHAAQIEAPFLVTRYFKSEETKLPHDGHPNRRGHGDFRNHFVHALDRLGWVPVPEAQLPELREDLSLEFNPAPDPAALRRYRERFVEKVLRTELDFAKLKPPEARSLLGGVFRGGNRGRVRSLPWASIQSGFALRRPDSGSDLVVEIAIEIPPLVELFPFRLDASVDGLPAGRYEFAEPNETGRYELALDVPPAAGSALAVEVVLRTPSYVSGISDARMNSFKLVSARVR
jgi:lysophospholipase L1-like esterase